MHHPTLESTAIYRTKAAAIAISPAALHPATCAAPPVYDGGGEPAVGLVVLPPYVPFGEPLVALPAAAPPANKKFAQVILVVLDV